MLILKILLLLFLFFVVAVLFMASSLVWKVRKLTRSFRKGQPKTHANYQQHRQDDGTVIIDQRQPKPKKTHIIDDDEGEYVDFEEV